MVTLTSVTIVVVRTSLPSFRHDDASVGKTPGWKGTHTDCPAPAFLPLIELGFPCSPDSPDTQWVQLGTLSPLSILTATDATLMGTLYSHETLFRSPVSLSAPFSHLSTLPTGLIRHFSSPWHPRATPRIWPQVRSASVISYRKSY